MGKGLAFSCECGFVSDTVMVGCGMAGPIYYDAAMCLKCHRIFAARRKGEVPEAPNCRNCHGKCMLLTDPGAWGPRALQEMFPGKWPWDVKDGDPYEERPTADDLALLSQLAILCPNCYKLTLIYECRVLWD
jgi:hypothetical protein